MASPQHACIQQSKPGEDAAAALATIAHHYALPITFQDMRSILELESLRLDLFYLLFACRKLHFQAVPLVGDFEHLPEVARPNIVLFKGEQQDQVEFRVLYEIDSESALIGNVKTGQTERLSKEAFSALWTGDAVQVLPDESDFPGMQKELSDLHNPIVQLQRVAGLSPLSVRKLLFLPVALATSLVVFTVISRTSFSPEGWIAGAIGICVILSMWSAAYSTSCRSCNRAAGLVGSLPLAAVGVVCYAALLVVAAFFSAPLLMSAGLFFAAGTHVWLVILLVRSRSLCWPCVGVAVSVWSASTIHVFTSNPVEWPAGVLAGFVLTMTITSYEREADKRRYEQAATTISRRVAKEKVNTQGKVRIVVYKRKNCPSCSFYESVIRPAIEEDFGDLVTIEERDAEKERIPTPFIVICGSVDLSMPGLPAENAYSDLKTAIEAALNPEPSNLKLPDGIQKVFALDPASESDINRR